MGPLRRVPDSPTEWRVPLAIQILCLLAALAVPALGQQQTCTPSFTYRIGDPSPLPASVTCTLTATSTALNYTLTPSAAWIVVAPTSGSVPANQTATITVSANPTGLAPANYSGTISTTAAGYTIPPFAVTLSVTPAAPLSPQITSALNAASFAIGGPLAPGVIFSIFGTSLTDGTTSSAPSIPLPTTLSGATVLVNGVAAPLYFAAPTQINVQFPVELSGISSASIQVQVRSASGNATSPAFTVQVASSSPGIFTLSENGSGTGLVFHATNFTLVCPAGLTGCTTGMAVPGETLSIYMTGLGQVNGTWISGQVPATPLQTVATPTITIGGIQAQVLFAGLTTNFVGIYQINVAVPLDAPGGNTVPVLVTLPDGKSSNLVTIPIQGPSSNSQNGGGPAGGTVQSIAIDPNTPTTMYAGTYEGVFKTTNGGITWSPTGDALLDLVQSLVIDPSNTATVYAGTRSGVVYKTVNGGATWFLANSGLKPVGTVTISTGGALLIDSSNPSTLYTALANGGIYKTTNGGSTWTILNSGLPSMDISGLAMDPLNHSNLYAATAYNGVYRSTNGGLNWTKINSPLLAQNVGVFAFDQRNPGTIYAGGVGIVKSTDSGATWASVSPGLGGNILALQIDPSNSNNLYAGLSPFNNLTGIYKSTNAGANWSRVSPDVPPDPNLWVYAFALNTAVPTTIYAGTRYGVLQSTNAGNNWTYATAGITAGGVRQLVIDPSNPGTLYAGSDNLIFKTTSGGATWNQSSSGYTANNFGGMAIDPSTPSTLYAISDLQGLFKTTNGGASWSLLSSAPVFGGLGSVLVDRSNSANVYIAGGSPGGVYKSTDRGQTWNQLGSLPGAYILAMDAGSSSTLYCTAGGQGGIYKTTNGGQSWTPINAGVSTESQTIIVADPVNSGVVYLGTYYDGLFKSTNGGATWARAGVSGLVQGISVDPSNPSTVYVATFGGLYKTTNGGVNWQSLGNSLPEAALYHYSVAIDPITPTNVYLGTSYGVFKSIDGGQSWQPTGAN